MNKPIQELVTKWSPQARQLMRTLEHYPANRGAQGVKELAYPWMVTYWCCLNGVRTFHSSCYLISETHQAGLGSIQLYLLILKTPTLILKNDFQIPTEWKCLLLSGGKCDLNVSAQYSPPTDLDQVAPQSFSSVKGWVWHSSIKLSCLG